MDAIGHPGMLGRNVQHLVVVDTGTDQEKFGIMIVQNVKALKNVLAMTWGVIMIMLAMLCAITVHIQVEDVVVQQDGMDYAAATVCMKFLFCRNQVPQINNIFKKFYLRNFVFNTF